MNSTPHWEPDFRPVLNNCWVAESIQVGVLPPLYCLAPLSSQLLQTLVNSIHFQLQAKKHDCEAKVQGSRRGTAREAVSSHLILVCDLLVGLSNHRRTDQNAPAVRRETVMGCHSENRLWKIVRSFLLTLALLTCSDEESCHLWSTVWRGWCDKDLRVTFWQAASQELRPSAQQAGVNWVLPTTFSMRLKRILLCPAVLQGLQSQKTLTAASQELLSQIPGPAQPHSGPRHTKTLR